MDDITLISLIFIVVFGIVIIFLMNTIKTISKSHKTLYRDYARRLIPGLGGGLMVFLGTQVFSIVNENQTLSSKILALTFWFILILMIVLLTLDIFILLETKSK